MCPISSLILGFLNSFIDLHESLVATDPDFIKWANWGLQFFQFIFQDGRPLLVQWMNLVEVYEGKVRSMGHLDVFHVNWEVAQFSNLAPSRGTLGFLWGRNWGRELVHGFPLSHNGRFIFFNRPDIWQLQVLSKTGNLSRTSWTPRKVISRVDSW